MIDETTTIATVDLDVLVAATRRPDRDAERAVRDARDELRPECAEATQLLASFNALEGAHGRPLDRAASLDLMVFRRLGVSSDILWQYAHFVNAARDCLRHGLGSAQGALTDVENLSPDDDLPRAVEEVRFKVRSARGALAAFPEAIAAASYWIAKLASVTRALGSDAPMGALVTFERPEPRQTSYATD